MIISELYGRVWFCVIWDLENVLPLDDSSSKEILEKLYDLENRILSADNSGLINEHRQLVEQDVALKLREVEDLILPLLINLKKDPEKEMIHWPNRTAIIDKQIEKIKAVTRYYERLN